MSNRVCHSCGGIEGQDCRCAEGVSSKQERIDVTPTWAGVLSALLALIENSNTEGRTYAIAELRRMADLADAYGAKVKRHREHTNNWRAKKKEAAQ